MEEGGGITERKRKRNREKEGGGIERKWKGAVREEKIARKRGRGIKRKR